MRITFTTLLILATWLAIWCLEPLPARAADGRVTVSPNGHPWESIGRLNVAGYRIRRHCTAALVAPDLVLTARHCLNAIGDGEWADPRTVHFLAGYSRGQFLAHRTASSYIRVGDEATLVRLSAPIDLPIIPLHPNPPPRDGAALSQAGYSGDKGHVLTVDPVCRLRDRMADGRWRHNCEAIGGDSGSPLLVDRPEGLAIAAIHVGRSGGFGIAEPVSSAILDGLPAAPQ